MSVPSTMASADGWGPNHYSGFPLHMRGEPERQNREGDQDRQPDQVGDNERHYAVKDGRYLDVVDHALDDEDVHADRRMNEAEFHRHDNDHAEPDRIEAERFDHREDDRDGQDDHR